MAGPDSDRWPASIERNESWNWQSDHVCGEAERLLDEGAGDDQLVVAVGRYAVENLILNAVHEIGEWLRFDGERIFAPHPTGRQSPAGDPQGNGPVQLTAVFTPSVPASPVVPTAGRPVDRVGARLAEIAAASRFTYLPGTTVSYRDAGPVIHFHTAGRSTNEWSSRWSDPTLEALREDVDAEGLISLVQRDVHGALVAWEADQTCRAFYVDQRRPWRLSGLGVDQQDADEIVTLTIGYLRPVPVRP